MNLENIMLNEKSQLKRTTYWDFPGGPVSKTLCSQCRGPKFDPWSGNWISHAITKNWHTATKDPTYHNKKKKKEKERTTYYYMIPFR